MDTILLMASLTSFFALIASWIGLPQSPESPPSVAPVQPAVQPA